MAFKIYLINLESLETLDVQFIPDELSTNSRGNYQDVMIVGRNTPVPHFTGGSEDIRFELDFYSEKENRQDVVKKVKWLKSLKYGDENGIVPRVKLVWGDLYKNEIWTVKSVDSKYSLFDKVAGMMPTQAYVSLVLSLDPDKNITAKQARK